MWCIFGHVTPSNAAPTKPSKPTVWGALPPLRVNWLAAQKADNMHLTECQ